MTMMGRGICFLDVIWDESCELCKTSPGRSNLERAIAALWLSEQIASCFHSLQSYFYKMLNNSMVKAVAVILICQVHIE